MKMKLGMKQTMQLRMTPQLQQAIKLLQMSRMELENAVFKELEENPILEESIENVEEQPNDQVEAAEEKGETVSSEQTADQQDPQKSDEFDWENFVDQSPPKMTNMSAGNEEIMNYENVISTPQSLTDYLIWQMNLSGFSDEEKHIGNILIGYIDDDGYIKTPFDQIAESEKVTVEDLEDIVTLIHEFDPPGIGARNLQECMLIQAKQLQEDTKDMVMIIQNHLKDLEKKNYHGIAKAMNLSIEEVGDICKIIFAMDPKPGRAYNPPDTQYVTPDVFVYQVGDDFVVSINDEGIPRLRISNFYKNVLQTQKDNKNQNVGEAQTQDYIQERLKSAIWLIKSIHQRQRTIYRVAESIVKHQKDFFERGPEYLKPMILRDIAADVGLHESTISRVTTSKYMHTPRGIFELKHFFNSGINRNDGEDAIASESVRLKIKDMVSNENVKAPLSDQKIVELLKKDGIDIARRTVAKYREALGILPSSRRKKIF